MLRVTAGALLALLPACGRDEVVVAIEPAASCEGGCSIQMDCLAFLELRIHEGPPDYEELAFRCADVGARESATLCETDLSNAIRTGIPDGAAYVDIVAYGPGFDDCAGPPLFAATAELDATDDVVAEAACNLSCATIGPRDYSLRIEDYDTETAPETVAAFQIDVGLLYDLDAIAEPTAAGFVGFDPFAAEHDAVDAAGEVVVRGSVTYDVPDGSPRCVAARVTSGDAQLPSLGCIEYDPAPVEPEVVVWLPPAPQNLIESFLRDRGRDPQQGYLVGSFVDAGDAPLAGATVTGLPNLPEDPDQVVIYYDIDDNLLPTAGPTEETGPAGLFVISGAFVGPLAFSAPGLATQSFTVGVAPGHSAVIGLRLEP